MLLEFSNKIEGVEAAELRGKKTRQRRGRETGWRLRRRCLGQKGGEEEFGDGGMEG